MEQEHNLKTCTGCHEEKSLDKFYKSQRGKYGVESICIACTKLKYQANKVRAAEQGKARYEKNREDILTKSKLYREKNIEDILIKDRARAKKKRIDFREAVLAADAAYREKNKDKIEGYKRKYAEDNIEALKVRRKATYYANREENIAKSLVWHQKNKEKSNRIKRRYAKDNPHVSARSRLKRRKMKRQCYTSWAKTEFDSMVVREIYLLARLRTETLGFAWHVDHIVPLVSDIVCGLHCSANLAVIPAKENLSKGNRNWPDMPN